MTQSLWGKTRSGNEIKVPVLGLCGEYGSGKTLFAVTIAPGKHPAGHPFEGKARTLVIDAEKSSETYAGSSLGFDRIDLVEKCMKKYPNGYNSIQLYEVIKEILDGIPAGRYDVIGVDPITDIDAGVTDYVKQYPTKFGLSSKQIEKTSGLLWGAVKELWNQILLQVASKCQTFVFTAHMRDVYVGNSPSGKREPKGKETLAKLATLYLQLERKPKSGVVPASPIGIQLKGRICDITISQDGEIVTTELLPKKFENCTPKTIRDLIAGAKINGLEYHEEHLSDDMRLAMELANNTQKNEVLDKTLEIEKARLQMAKLSSNSTPPVPTSPNVAKPEAAPMPSQPECVPPPHDDMETISDIEEAKKTSKAETPKEDSPFPENPQQVFTLPKVPEANMEAMMLDIKVGIKDNRIPKAYVKDMMSVHCVAKVSDLPVEVIRDMFVRVNETYEIYRIVNEKQIPMDKPMEFAQKFGKSSVFELSSESRNQMYNFICNALPG